MGSKSVSDRVQAISYPLLTTSGPEIDCTTIGGFLETSCADFAGRRLEDFPEMVEDHNEAVADLESHLVKYLKKGEAAKKRPTLRKGGFLGIVGGEKKVGHWSRCPLKRQDAIDYLAKKIKFLRDRIDAKRQAVDSLLRQERRARKGGQRASRIEGENYGGSHLSSFQLTLHRLCHFQDHF